MTRIKILVLLCVVVAAISTASGAAEGDKVVVIGLDGASYTFMQDCLETGELPNLNALAGDDAFREMTAPLPPLTPVAMSSFLTGLNPGGHGIYGFEKRTSFSYDTRLVSARFLERMLPQELDGSSILVNVPMTYPAPAIDGVVVSGFPGSTEGPYVHPPTLRGRLEEMDYQVTTAGTFTNTEELEQQVFDLFEKRRNLTLDLMAENDWRFTMVMFTGDARLLHFLPAERCEDAIKRYYEELDRFVGTVRERVGENTTVVVMSNHGFEPLKKQINLYTFLKEHDYLEPKTVPYYKHWLQSILGGIASTLGLQEDDRVGRTTFSSRYMDEVDWSRTKAYTGAYYNGQIFLNVEGREPDGTVPREDYEEVRANIIADLKQLTDPDTGEGVFENVYTKEEVYNGTKMDDLPDIVVESPGYNHVAKFGFGRTFTTDIAESAAPVKEGFVLADRPITGENATIIDLASSVASMLGTDFGEGRNLFGDG